MRRPSFVPLRNFMEIDMINNFDWSRPTSHRGRLQKDDDIERAKKMCSRKRFTILNIEESGRVDLLIRQRWRRAAAGVERGVVM